MNGQEVFLWLAGVGEIAPTDAWLTVLSLVSVDECPVILTRSVVM